MHKQKQHYYERIAVLDIEGNTSTTQYGQDQLYLRILSLRLILS